MTTPSAEQKVKKVADYFTAFLIIVLAFFLVPVGLHAYLEYGLSVQTPPSDNLLWLLSLAFAAGPFIVIAIEKEHSALSFPWAVVTAITTVVMMHYFLTWGVTIQVPINDAIIWMLSGGVIGVLLAGIVVGTICYFGIILLVTLIASAG
jgi:hypothetical protein